VYPVGALVSLVPALLAVPLTPRQVARLPEWAAPAAREATAETPPADADAWVLMQRTELAYVGDGRVRARQLRLVLVLGERGLEAQSLRKDELGGKGSKLKRFKGWNARPDGDVEEIERSDTLSFDDGSSRVVTAQFARAMKGSLLATEIVVETEHPMGPTELLGVMEDQPVREWRVEARSEKPGVGVRLEPRHLTPWAEPAGGEAAGTLRLRDVPARPRDEPAAPHSRNVFPWVYVGFDDAALGADVPGDGSWDALAAWTQGRYAAHVAAATLTGVGSSDPKERLRAIHDWMSRQLTYRQVYLTPDRGWIPSSADDVRRRQYGDCKDLTTFFLSEARAAGLSAYPALARIVAGEVEEGEPPNVFAFNHVIAAVRLPASLGLPAEVETPAGRFLLVDPTGRFVPFGWLHEAHAGRRVLVCLEKGGVWVAVPAAAIARGRTLFRLEGEVIQPDAFKGTLEVREEDGRSSLRYLHVEGGDDALRKFCLGLGLPPDARCEIQKRTDPLDLQAPYDVVFALAYNLPVRQAGAREWTIDPPGFPRPPEPLQKPGQPRSLPVVVEARSSLEYEMRLRLPWSVVPVGPGERGETPFRTYSWTSQVRPEPRGAEREFRFSEERLARSFDYDRREEGVAAWKKDRSLVRRVHEEGLVFRTP